MKRLQIMIDEEVDRALGEQAARDHTSKASLVRRYVDMALQSVPALEDDPLSRLVGAADFEPAEVDDLLRTVIFVDTSFWVALTNRRDPHHGEAVSLLADHRGERLLTTCDVRGETWTFLRRRAGHRIAVEFLDDLSASPRLELVRSTESVERQAIAWLRERDEREYSWVDATSFATMRQRHVERAFSFDGDFSAAGFVELRK